MSGDGAEGLTFDEVAYHIAEAKTCDDVLAPFALPWSWRITDIERCYLVTGAARKYHAIQIAQIRAAQQQKVATAPEVKH